jgi:transposase
MAGIEIITRTERRRRWSRADRARILAECAAPDAIIAEVCRRNDIVSSLVHKWRKQEREKAARGPLPPFIGYGELAALPPHIEFPVGSIDLQRHDQQQLPSDRAVATPGVIEIALPGGVQVSIRGDVSHQLLASVIQCLRFGPC